MNASAFYFCKMFKKVTGINFTDCVSRQRIKSAKNLLLNSKLRVSEIAYDVGFQSLTHFNRVFKKIIGQSPNIAASWRTGDAGSALSRIVSRADNPYRARDGRHFQNEPGTIDGPRARPGG